MKSVLLDGDSKIFENNLLLKSVKEEENEFENIFRLNGDVKNSDEPWKLVKPTPGLVVKTADLRGNKVFINLCHTSEIPEPQDLSDAELLSLWQSDQIPNYRVPLSMMDPHDELDKSGKEAVVYDVAVNTKFFEKLKGNNLFRSFVVQVVLDGLENKYNIELKKEDYIILRNRSAIGDLKPHRIRGCKETYQPPKRLIEELNSGEYSGGKLLENKLNQPAEHLNYRLLSGNNLVLGQFYLPKISSCRDIKLDIGENRIALETATGDYSADLFLPSDVNKNNSTAHFNLTNKVLTVFLPLQTCV